MPDIIELLPESVANQIAAGEVVQRPASAVKELIENAIDAGADQIKLIIKNAGKSLIQVIDNGCGMSSRDAKTSLLRHATSKIRKAEDLFAIKSMGFRGEAMASIAAIAQLEIRTRRHEDELGTVLEVSGSALNNEYSDAMPTGTSIRVKNLFFNIPARRNFLKSDAVEFRHIVDEFQRVALAHPEIHFSFYNDDIEIYHLPIGTLKQRIVHVFGNNYNERLVPVLEDTTIIKVNGFIGKPKYAKKARGEQFIFVNKRFIKDAYLNHAILKAYEEVLPDDTYPLYILNIEIDPSKIDINVHPTKTEIKFEEEKSIYAILRSAIRRSLGQYNISPSLDFEQEPGFANLIQAKPLGEIQAPTISFDPNFNPFLNESGNEKPSTNSSGGAYKKSPLAPNQDWESLFEVTKKVSPEQLTLAQSNDQEDTSPKRLFQLHKRFILSQIHSGLMIIDQQAAHERILYEQILHRLANQQASSQQSLFPQTLTVDPGDLQILESLLPAMQTLGFQLREFGKNTFVIEGIPADIGIGTDEKEIILTLIEDFKNNRPSTHMAQNDHLAKSLARSASIKAGASLSEEEMAELIDRLFACEFANTSIQGKPVILTFTIPELLAQFQ
jgi:DNA mismatch repair protein MutL